MKNFIKQIKSATTKDELHKITYNALCSDNITKKQYDKIVANAVCREIELGIWKSLDQYPNKEIALEKAQKQFGIKY